MSLQKNIEIKRAAISLLQFGLFLQMYFWERVGLFADFSKAFNGERVCEGMNHIENGIFWNGINFQNETVKACSFIKSSKEMFEQHKL